MLDLLRRVTFFDRLLLLFALPGDARETLFERVAILRIAAEFVVGPQTREIPLLRLARIELLLERLFELVEQLRRAGDLLVLLRFKNAVEGKTALLGARLDRLAQLLERRRSLLLRRRQINRREVHLRRRRYRLAPRRGRGLVPRPHRNRGARPADAVPNTPSN